MYLLEVINTCGARNTVPFPSLSKLIAAYQSEKRFNEAYMYMYLNNQLLSIEP